jgi:hypothetical protein
VTLQSREGKRGQRLVNNRRNPHEHSKAMKSACGFDVGREEAGTTPD